MTSPLELIDSIPELEQELELDCNTLPVLMFKRWLMH